MPSELVTSSLETPLPMGFHVLFSNLQFGNLLRRTVPRENIPCFASHKTKFKEVAIVIVKVQFVSNISWNFPAQSHHNI